MQQYNKAIVALLSPAIVTIGARYGMNLSTEEAAILASLVTGLIVYLVPNKYQPSHRIEAYIEALEAKVKQAEKDAVATKELL